MQSNARDYWLTTMRRIVDPVLLPLSERRLHECLPLTFHPERALFAPLEAFARSVCGIAPWLEAEMPEPEEMLRRQYVEMVHACIDAATDPASPDHMLFDGRHGGQPLVDAAFLAHALVRAPKQMAGALDDRVRQNLASALRETRGIVPPRSNWLFFRAMVEAGLYLLGEGYERCAITEAVDAFMEWYKGDGVYGDGPALHVDYYNSFVIQPMLMDLVVLFWDTGWWSEEQMRMIRARATRHAAILERLIAPDGTYPIVGRSTVYRFGAFQLLSQAVLQGFLPEEVAPAQVRCALTAVIRRVMEAPQTFDGEGFLRPGVCGYQPDLAEGYINTGSLYLCSTVFLPLGLNPGDPFWSAPDAKWTAKRIWAGENVIADHATEM